MNVKRILEILGTLRENALPVGLTAAGLIFIFEAFFLNRSHVAFELEKIPGFWGIFGAFSCAIIVLFAKWLGHLGLLKDETYYDDERK